MVVWDWPQIAWVVLVVLGLGWTLAKHGQTTRHNGIASLIGVALGVVLLLAGGFWHKPAPCRVETHIVPLAE